MGASDKDEIMIRAAIPDDCFFLLPMYRDKAGVEGLADRLSVDETGIRAQIERGYSTILLAYMNEKLCGFANFHYEDSTFTGRSILMVKDLYTVPAFRSRGVAKALLRYMAQRADDRGCIMGIGPLTTNDGPLAWYTSLGAQHSYDIANLEITDLKSFIRNLNA